MEGKKFEQEIKPFYLKFKRGSYDNMLVVWRDSEKLMVNVNYQDIIEKYGPDNKEARKALSELCDEVKNFLISRFGEQNVIKKDNFCYYLESVDGQDVIRALVENFLSK